MDNNNENKECIASFRHICYFRYERECGCVGFLFLFVLFFVFDLFVCFLINLYMMN